jgi:hypothetical protein
MLIRAPMPATNISGLALSGNTATKSRPVAHTGRLRTRAAKEGKTLSETVAMLCSIGLLDLDESDRFEPEVNPRPDARHDQRPGA